MGQNNEDKWEALTTIKTFDFGLPEDIQHDSILHSHINQQPIDIINAGASTPISLLVQSLVQQLCSLLEKDQTKANKLYNLICEKLHSMRLIDDSYAMGEFEVMRSLYQRALYQLVTVTTGAENPINLPDSLAIVQPSGLEWSRYHREFEEICFVAGGGFGSVFKAKHRLDGVEYAVKKVFIKSSDVHSIMTHLSEVKTIASLNHTNIVSYKAAWLEPMIEEPIKKKKHKCKIEVNNETCTFKSTSVMSSAYPDIINTFKTHNSNELLVNKSESDFSISFRSSNTNSDESMSSEDSDLTEGSKEESSTQNDCNAVCKWLQTKEYENCSRVNLKWATLYIQMSFCQQTLKQWLDERNEQISLQRKSNMFSLHHSDSNDSTNLDSTLANIDGRFPVFCSHIDLLVEMFTQLVYGLHYIHSRGIIHHDIKPSNVFIGKSEGRLQVQLGDFGLACPLQKSHSGLVVGTQLYAAPEQLEGQCNPKSDMYSLGIILLELVEPFDTAMERIKTITDLRKGQIPAHLTATYPKIAHIIGKLVQRRPNKRLDTTQLLQELKTLNENKDSTIQSLRDELREKDNEIARLKIMLEQCNRKS